jgi:hypothetical protein
MEEMSGWSAIDTLYEIKGFQLAANFFGPLYMILVAVLFGFGTITVLYRTSIENRYRGVVVYIASAILLMWLIAPITVQVSVPAGYAYDGTLEELVQSAASGRGPYAVVERVPRIMAWMHHSIDALTHQLVGAVNSSFAKQPFGQDRGAVLLRLSKIQDEVLRTKYQTFVLSCYVPVLARREHEKRPAPDPYYDPFKVTPLSDYNGFRMPGGVRVSPSTSGPVYTMETIPGDPCEDLARTLYQDLQNHVSKDAIHQETVKVVQGVLQKGSHSSVAVGIVNDIILRYLVHNETLGLLGTNEVRALQEAVPDYEMFDRKTQTSGGSQDWVDRVRTTVSWLVKIRQSVDQWIKHHAEGPALYFKVACYAPTMYGLAGMVILAIFPFAGFIALLPGHWTALLLWAKYLLWVKLWMVFWSVLSKFNEWRYSLEDIGSDPSNGIGDASYIFPAIAAMYLLTPGLSAIVVTLLSAASKGIGTALGSLAPSGGGNQYNPLQAADSAQNMGRQASESLGGSGDGGGAALRSPECPDPAGGTGAGAGGIGGAPGSSGGAAGGEAAGPAEAAAALVV